MKVELREHGFAFEGNEPESNASGLLALLVGLLLILLQHYRVYTLSTFLGARLDEDVVPIKCRQEQLGQDLPNSLQVSTPWLLYFRYGRGGTLPGDAPHEGLWNKLSSKREEDVVERVPVANKLHRIVEV